MSWLHIIKMSISPWFTYSMQFQLKYKLYMKNIGLQADMLIFLKKED